MFISQEESERLVPYSQPFDNIAEFDLPNYINNLIINDQ